MTVARPLPTELSLKRILILGAAIVTMSMGIRHGFGLWLQPVIQTHGWNREAFSTAIAVQNIAWGVAGVFAGMVADRFGAMRVLLVGALLYALGLVGMAVAPSPLLFALGAGVVIGMAQAGTTYAVIYGVIGRNVPEAQRSWAMGITAAAGSFGQFLMVPVENQLIQLMGWQGALWVLAAMVLLIVPLAAGLREPGFAPGAAPRREQTLLQALSEAMRYRSFLLLTAGYFVCGFQLVFIGVHMPSYLKDHGLEPHVASYALGLIGLFNVIGTYTAGAMGQRMRKTRILAIIYLSRSAVIALFLLAPLSPLTVYLFAAGMGLLWLSTVPPTHATIAGIFGAAHFSMLSGFVFLSHQIGSFFGAWLGGVLYDRTGSYDIVWGLAIALGIMACLVNLPVNERPIARANAGAAGAAA